MVNKWYGTEAKPLSNPYNIHLRIYYKTNASTKFDTIHVDKTGGICRSN